MSTGEAATLPVLSSNVIKQSPNQVAGHHIEGHPDSSVDESGNFYKPVQGDERGEREVKFYETFWADHTVPPAIQKFFPRYHGCVLIEGDNGTGLIKHVVLEDVTKGFRHPSIMDIKIGPHTWYPGASKEYIAKCVKKDKESTSAAVGYRISGVQVYEQATGLTWKTDRDWSRNLKPEEVLPVLKRFVSTNPFEEVNINAALASEIYGGEDGIISQLKELLPWFEEQCQYHFFSSSVLIIYEGDHNSKMAPRPIVTRLIDFAHITYGHDNIDENYLAGLKALINHLCSAI